MKNKSTTIAAKPKPKKVQQNRIIEAPAQDRSHRIVTEDGIRERAYLIWKDLGEPHGQETNHWVRAERELTRGL